MKKWEVRILKSKLFNPGLVIYEIRNIIGNIFITIFGIFFPIFMAIFMGKVTTLQIPEEGRVAAMTTIFLSSILIIPLATVLIGYAALYSQELENQIPLRFKLYGYNEKTILVSKIIANLIFITLGMALFSIIVPSVITIERPTIKSALILLVSIYLVTIIVFILAHGIALFIKRFGPTFAVSMVLYFGIMILSGMFGVQASQFPETLQAVAYTLPTTYICGEFIDFWTGASYNFMPFIQSLIFFASVSIIILLLAINRNARRVN